MSFSEQIESDLDDLFAEDIAKPAVYKYHSDDLEISLDAVIFIRGQSLNKKEGNQLEEGKVLIQTKFLPRTPSYKDKLTITFSEAKIEEWFVLSTNKTHQDFVFSSQVYRNTRAAL